MRSATTHGRRNQLVPGSERVLNVGMMTSIFKIALIFVLSAPIALSQVCNSIVRDSSGSRSPHQGSDDVRFVIHGKVTFVIDGDTLTVLADDGVPRAVRLFGIDAPDLRQAYGQESADRLGVLLTGKDVTLEVSYIDQKGVNFGEVLIDGEDAGLDQLKSGMAWVYLPNGCGDRFRKKLMYLNAESNAKSETLGLWKDPDPVSPWSYRGEYYDNAIAGPDSRPDQSAATRGQDPSAGPGSLSVVVKPIPEERKYVLGPRGGCYYINERHTRIYVADKTLCGK